MVPPLPSASWLLAILVLMAGVVPGEGDCTASDQALALGKTKGLPILPFVSQTEPWNDQLGRPLPVDPTCFPVVLADRIRVPFLNRRRLDSLSVVARQKYPS